MAVKPTNPADYREITYTTARWAILRELRDEATKIMTALEAVAFSRQHSWKHSKRRRQNDQ